MAKATLDYLLIVRGSLHTISAEGSHSRRDFGPQSLKYLLSDPLQEALPSLILTSDLTADSLEMQVTH